MILTLYSTGNENTDLISEMEISAAFSTALFSIITETQEKRTSGKKQWFLIPVLGMVEEETLIKRH